MAEVGEVVNGFADALLIVDANVGDTGGLRSDVLDLARRSHVGVGQVYKVDASRRTTGANASIAPASMLT